MAHEIFIRKIHFFNIKTLDSSIILHTFIKICWSRAIPLKGGFTALSFTRWRGYQTQLFVVRHLLGNVGRFG